MVWDCGKWLLHCINVFLTMKGEVVIYITDIFVIAGVIWYLVWSISLFRNLRLQTDVHMKKLDVLISIDKTLKKLNDKHPG